MKRYPLGSAAPEVTTALGGLGGGGDLESSPWPASVNLGASGAYSGAYSKPYAGGSGGLSIPGVFGGPPGANNVFVNGGAKTVSMAGVPSNILPYQPPAGSIGLGGQQYAGASGAGVGGRGHHATDDGEGVKRALTLGGLVWLGGLLLGYSWLWPLYVLLDLVGAVLSIPPFSWLFGWVWSPFSWMFGWLYRGVPLVEQGTALQELRIAPGEVASYIDSYTSQYGDAALIFASHDGYPQVVNNLLQARELGYRDLIDASDDIGNTALIYASAKGYRQVVAALLRYGADPDVNNHGGGRTPLMEASGAGFKDIVAAIRTANATIDLADDYGNTALHYAAYHGHVSVVSELLKSNPRRDLKNTYGQTAAAYAASNKHKAIVGVLSRAPSRKAKELADREGSVEQDELPALPARGQKVEKHVKGGAEDIHKKDWMDFAPKLEHVVTGATDNERRALEDQMAKLKRLHEDAELKAQRRIVELLEKNSEQQKAVDEAQRQARALQLNNTELSIQLQDLQTKRQSSEIRATEEQQRADRAMEELHQFRLEADRHKSRAEGAERERDLHATAASRHEDRLREKQSEIGDHVQRLDRQSRELAAAYDEIRQQRVKIAKLGGGTGVGIDSQFPALNASTPAVSRLTPQGAAEADAVPRPSVGAATAMAPSADTHADRSNFSDEEATVPGTAAGAGIGVAKPPPPPPGTVHLSEM